MGNPKLPTPAQHPSKRSFPLSSTLLSDSPIVCQGWLLKKRRKRMQGYARRYFTLYNTGTLSYCFEPGQPGRDELSLHHAAISTTPGRKDIHLDSGNATFHIRCLSTEDFDTWMTAFRKFVTIGVEVRRSASVRLQSRQATINFNRSNPILEEMGVTLANLELAIAGVKEATPVKKSHSLSKKSDKEKHRDHGRDTHLKFGLFKRSSHHSLATDNIPEVVIDSTHIESDLSGPQQLRLILDTLKAQHAALTRSLQQMNHGDITHSPHHAALPATTEEELSESPKQAWTPLTRRSKHASISTTVSEPSSWFDAVDSIHDGAEEFILEVQTPIDDIETPSRILDDQSAHSARSSVDTDSKGHAVIRPSPSIPYSPPSSQVPRRQQLPSPPIGDEGSLFTVLKKNVGKDLSTIALPVTFNEPLTLLQRAAEEVEYYELLNQAAATNDPIERISFVAAFAVSGYTHTRHRSGRKGFNPMLAETFEDIRMKFIAEKVRHNPFEMAYHAEGKNWELSATSSGKTKFWGKSLEIIPLGATYLTIGQDRYVWKKPSSFMRNMMVGTKYLEHCGKLIIENETRKLRCVLEFKQNGYWGASNVVSGSVQDPQGDVVRELEGKWDEQLAQALDSSNFRLIWRASPFPKNANEYYGFTSFGITLNEVTSDIAGKLPLTDSRFRPDVRALENGDLDRAEEQKRIVEEKQRERRREGVEQQPRWFKQVGDRWDYVGGYWEARDRGWKDTEIRPLW